MKRTYEYSCNSNIALAPSRRSTQSCAHHALPASPCAPSAAPSPALPPPPSASSDCVQLAQSGDAESQYALGQWYEFGLQGFPQCLRQAAFWYSLASEENHMHAQYRLARLHDNTSLPHNDLLAARWYKQSALQGHPMAQNNLGWMYMYGKGLKQDFGKAAHWYKQSAKQGDCCAQYNLGTMYDDGLGVPKDFQKALKWYQRSAEQTPGDPDAQCALGKFHYLGKGTAVNYQEASKWYMLAACQGHPTAQYNLALMYEDGQGVDRSDYIAFEWYQKAALQGNGFAQNNLGVMYEYGKGVELSYEKAFEWYQKASENGLTHAQCNMGLLYEEGKFVSRDISKANHWFEKAANLGHWKAPLYLARLYLRLQLMEKAWLWFRKSAKLHPEAEIECNNMIENGTASRLWPLTHADLLPFHQQCILEVLCITQFYLSKDLQQYLIKQMVLTYPPSHFKINLQ